MLLLSQMNHYFKHDNLLCNLPSILMCTAPVLSFLTNHVAWHITVLSIHATDVSLIFWGPNLTCIFFKLQIFLV